uniref:Uncharacterized protein n=1 Tax=Arion vulgaris TaxID=1028688 RepID=A0A0B6ZZV2_9EUPU
MDVCRMQPKHVDMDMCVQCILSTVTKNLSNRQQMVWTEEIENDKTLTGMRYQG